MTGQAATTGTKACRFCAEQILAAATVCKHCGKNQKRKPSTGNTVVSVLALVVFFGLILAVGCAVVVGGLLTTSR